MRVTALIIRILRQFIRDKRTMALLIFAPIFILTMLHLVFNGNKYEPKIGLIHVPEAIEKQLHFQHADILTYQNLERGKKDLEAKKLDAYITFQNSLPSITLEGSDPNINGAVINTVEKAFKPLQQPAAAKEPELHFLHGSKEMGQFDYFGPVLLGFFVFFFVFLIAGVSFLRERTTGTLERLFSSPLRRWEIIAGYLLGFGLFTVLQAAMIAAYAIYVLGMLMEGSFGYVLLIILLLALTALSVGIFLSSFANNELQMMQFIPIVVVPQIFFSGLFNLETISEWVSWIGPLTPLYYAADALRDVMVRGYGWHAIYGNLLVLIGFCAIFITLNLFALKKYRKI